MPNTTIKNQSIQMLHGKQAKMQTTTNINLITLCRPTCNPTLHKYSGVGAKHHVDPRKIICISKISVQGTQRVKVIFKWLKEYYSNI